MRSTKFKVADLLLVLPSLPSVPYLHSADVIAYPTMYLQQRGCGEHSCVCLRLPRR